MKKRLIAVIAAVLLIATLFAGCSGGGGSKTTINVLNWGEYIDPDIIKEFEKANPDIKINYTTTLSNEEMYTLCTTEGSKLDIIFPSDYLVERLINEDMLVALNYDNIPNFKYVEESSKTRTFDSDSKYSVPYMMGTVGIIYNKTLVDDVVDSWDILWNEKYSGKIMMYDSMRDSLMVALSRLGYDINTKDESQLREATDMLIAQRPMVQAYGTDDIQSAMVGGSVALAVDYSGSAAAAIAENDDLDYVVPKEGSNIWVDNIVILKTTSDQDAAEKFLNFLCEPEIMARNAEYIGYTTPSKEAEALIDEELLTNPAYLITADMLERTTYFSDLGEDGMKMYNDLWMEIKTS